MKKAVALLSMIIFTASCATNNSTQVPPGGVIEFALKEKSSFNTDPMASLIAKVPPIVNGIEDKGNYKSKHISIQVKELSDGYMIAKRFEEFCLSKGNTYTANAPEAGLCKNDKKQVFFVRFRSTVSTPTSFIFAYIYENTSDDPYALQSLVTESDSTVLAKQIKQKENEFIIEQKLKRNQQEIRTVGTYICAISGYQRGYIEKVVDNKIQIRLLSQAIIWDSPENWTLCN